MGSYDGFYYKVVDTFPDCGFGKFLLVEPIVEKIERALTGIGVVVCFLTGRADEIFVVFVYGVIC